MCGIAGLVKFHSACGEASEDLASLTLPLRFRGPDAAGYLEWTGVDKTLWFGHRRLRIIDLSDAANQPMESCSGKSIIVFNGEIYNYRELKIELTVLGYSFATNSDTEVILNAFECWGMDGTLLRLDGMFAFALFDKSAEQLFLARDRFGKKPLYYYRDNKQFVFSSDIRSFKTLKSVNLNLDLHALGYFFAELSTPRIHTIWKEVKKVTPASYLHIDRNGSVVEKAYWELKYSENCTLTRDQIIERTEELLLKSVTKRLVADVKVSALLSGGIDSSLVVAKMAEASNTRIKTYSVGFKEDEFNELSFSREVARKFDTDHTEIVLEDNALSQVNDLILEYGEPFADSSMIPSYLICRKVSQYEKVVMGGDGGDELFAGYFSYYLAHKFDAVKKFSWAYGIVNILHRMTTSYRVRLLKYLLTQTRLPRHTLLNRNLGFDTFELMKLYRNPLFYEGLDSEHDYVWKHFTPHSSRELINVLSASMKTRLLNDYLVKIDRASMYASLEMRSPFLDKDLAEFAATLTPAQLLYKGKPKSILKDLASKYFSSSFVNRNKMGFSIPIGSWFKGSHRERLNEIILEGKQKLVDLNYNYIEQIIREHGEGRKDHSHKLWALYVFHLWAQNQ